MEDMNELTKDLSINNELEEISKLYYNCINLDKIKLLESPSLKYALYNLNLFEAFKVRISQMNTEIEELKKSLKIYKSKFDTTEEIEKLNEIKNKLIDIEKEAINEYHFYKIYLINTAEEYDFSKDSKTKGVFIKCSKDIIKFRIKYYLNYEKYFIIYSDIFNEIKQIF